MGVKGIGEAGTIAAPPAVINAVVDALAHLGVRDMAPGDARARLAGDPGGTGGEVMIPAPFEYEVAESAEHAIELLGSKEDEAHRRRPGLLPLMKFRLARPATLVDLGRLSDLAGVRDGGDHLAIGALTRHRSEHDALVQEQCPILAYAAGLVGDRQVRHLGTIGGSLACDPAADLPTVALTLDAEIVLRGPGGERVPAPRSSSAASTRRRAGRTSWSSRCACRKRARRAGRTSSSGDVHSSWATVGVAAVVEGSGSIERARIGLTNMGRTPVPGRARPRRRSPAPRAGRHRRRRGEGRRGD